LRRRKGVGRVASTKTAGSKKDVSQEESMSVSWILKDKGRSVVSVLPSASLNEVIVLLATKRIGAIVVADELYRPVGIISERDIVRILATQGGQALDEPVGEHMTRPVVTCNESHSLDYLMSEMTKNRFRHVPVTEEGRLNGIVSIGDVVKFKLAQAESEAAQLRQYFVAG
jgi:CBS domain-containing protein